MTKQTKRPWRILTHQGQFAPCTGEVFGLSCLCRVSRAGTSSQQTPPNARPDSSRESVGLCRGRQEEKQAHTLESKGRADPAYGGVTVTPTETGKHLSRTRSRRPRPVTPKSGNGGARRLIHVTGYLIGSGDQQYRLHTLTACVVSGGVLQPE